MTNSDKDPARHGKYGDTPLGKSDEELRGEGADALTNSERRSHAEMGQSEEIEVAVPAGGVAGAAAPAVAPELADADDRTRREGD